MAAPASTPLVSLITPVLNGDRYLAAALESVRGQTLQAWECLVVDGGSRDRTLEIAERFAADPRIRVVSEPDAGMYDGLLKGLALTSAPLCAWVNADDRLMPWACELVARYVALTAADWITGQPACMDQHGLVHTIDGVKWYPRALIRAGLFHGRALGFIQQEGTFFRRSLFERLDRATLERIRATRQAGDFLLWRALARFAPLRVVPTVLGVFRLHATNMTADPSAYYRELAAAGIWLPPRPLALLAKAMHQPLAFLAYKRGLPAWRDVVRRLPAVDAQP
jgi:glycosyltransferase involved in cell wall biosynthesis